jgi:arabinofuranosyltransferase
MLRGARADLLIGLAATVALAFFAFRERQIAGTAGFPLDDAWIHLHFARNLAEGAGFSYNPGTAVAGSTAPLWTLILAAGMLVGGPSLGLVKVLGIVGTLTTGLLTRRAAVAWGASEPAALAAGIGVVASGALTWGALSGMEVSLAAALVAAALLAHARDATLATALLASLAVLARPEAILLLPAFAVARPWSTRRVLIHLGIAILVLSPFVVFCLMTVGTPWPATAAAKVEGGLVGWLTGGSASARVTFVERPWAFSREWVEWLATTHWLLPIALVPALVVVWWRQGRALGGPALVLLMHPIAMALLAPYRGPGFQEGRYSMHLLPLALLLLAAAIPRTFIRTSVVVAVVYLALAVPTLVPAAARYAWGVQNINAMQVHIGRWVDRELPRTARVATNDIGAIAYFSRREIIDLMGLVTPAIIPYRRDGDAGVLRYLEETCPDHVVIFPAWFPALAARADLLEPRLRVRLEHNEVAGDAEMVVYRVKRCAV